MALYHFSGQIISRSTGRSSVCAAAYRSASKFKDERIDRTFDYQKKSDDLLFETILLPAGSPTWMKNREDLWNDVEKIEKRKDAQLAREFNISLPRELTTDQNLELIQSFVKNEFVDQGMVADVCVHRGHSHGEDQPHAHVMLTLREVTPDGFGQKVRDWNDRAYINHWRESWADHCNHKFLELGIDQRIDHRTLEAQGIDLEPQRKIGPKSAQSKLARFEEHQAIAKRNGKRLLQNPEIALKALTQNQSTFTHQDIARFVNRHSASQDQFQAVYETIKSHPELVKLGVDEQGRDRFSTREMIDCESNLLKISIEKSNDQRFSISTSDTQAVCAHYDLSEGQKTAFEHVVHGQDLSCVVGVAGSGKSYLLGAAREAWERAGYRVQGMTLSGIAAENLETSSEIKSYTVASRLWHWERDRERLTSKDVVVIDEAGMLGSRQMNQVLSEVHRAGAKAVLIGDPEQLQAIDAGAAFRAISERVGFSELLEVRRQAEPWQQDATVHLSKGETEKALSAYQERGHIVVHPTQVDAMKSMVDGWRENQQHEPSKRQILLAYTRDDVEQLNCAVRENRKAHHELGEDHLLTVERGKREFAVGDHIYFLRNEKSLGVKNGTLGTIEAISGQSLSVKLSTLNGITPEARIVSFHLGDYKAIDHGYAATIHKAQGVTVDRAQVLASPYFDRHTSYVALSRHRDRVTLHASREVFANDQKLTQTLSRERSKDFTQDYSFDQEARILSKAPDRDLTTPNSKSILNFSRSKVSQAMEERDMLRRERAASYREKILNFGQSSQPVNVNKPASLEDQKRALEIETKCIRLEESISRSRFAMAERNRLASYARELNRSPQILSELKAKNPKLVERMMEFGKSHERELDRGIDR